MNKMNLKNLKFGINNTIIVVFAIVIVMLLNILTVLTETKLPKLKIDLTENAVTKIGNETKTVLKKLDEGNCEVEIIYLKGMGDADTQVTSVLEQYDAFSKNISYSIVNYHKNPVLLTSYRIDSNSNVDGSVLVATKDKSKARLINYADMQRREQNSTVFVLENLLTNAIGVVSSEKQMKVCFTTGHGEVVGQDNAQNDGMMLAGFLRGENISVYQYDVSTGAIPGEIDLVMITSPVKDFTREEINNLDDYLLSGGNVAVSLPSMVKLERLEDYLSTWGVRVNNDIVSENDSQMKIDDSGIYFYAQKGECKALSDVEGRIIASYMKSLEVESVGDIAADVLLSTGEEAVSMPIKDNAIDKTNITMGRFDLAYMLEKPLDGSYENTAKLIVTSGEAVWGITREMVTNYDAIVYNSLLETRFGNADFVMSVLSDVFGEDIQSIYVPMKTRHVSTLAMSQAQADVLNVCLGFVLPALVILAGCIVWLKRRNK